MPELVPTFILDRSEPRGRFPAASLRVDVSGFTAATSALMAHGSEAAEAIADIMEAIFTPLVDAVTDRGGFVATFSGDAFTAVFPLTSDDAAEAGRRAHAAAVAMRDHLAAHPTHRTRFGRFAFTARFGVGSGDVGWGILRPDGSFGHAAADHLAAIYYFNGTAIESAVAAEGLAPDGEIVVGLGSVPTLESPADLAPALPAHPVASSGAPTSAAARFVPAAILERSARGEFRQVVSVFINLRNAGTHEDLDEFASVVFDLQTRHGGYLNKVEFGDKGCTFLLFWGAPTSHENDLERALGFLLDLSSRAGSDFRAGVTYRHVYAGLIGSARRGEYTCYGEGVNLAARLMSAAPAGGVWLDAAVARRAPREFVFDGRGSLSFKGFAEPVAVHELAGRQAVSERSFFQGEMIGRAAERVRVTDFVRPILDSGASAWGGVLEVVGEAGLGKSRLVHEALSDPSISQRVQHFTAQTDQTLRQSFNPFTYWLKRYFEQSPLRSEAENVDAFNGRLDRLISATADAALRAELDRLRSVLGALVGLLWEGSLYSQLEPRGRHENTLIALQQLVRAEALRLPLVLVLEDAHWLDDASGEALVEFSRNLTDVRFALITLTRPVPAELSTLREIAHETLELGPLDTGEMAALALSILRAPPGPVLRALLAARAEGNPFFAEQIVRYLQEESVLEMRDGEWELVTRSRTGVLPDDLRLLFIARLDRLASALKATVQAAAILGREFEVQALSMMLRDEAEVRAHLREGEDERVWSAVSQLGYLFKHALLHTAAYEMQLTATRRQLHRLAAESLETLHAQQPSSHYAEIAYHFETACALGIAEVREEAVRYLHLAGAFQASRFENSAAIDSYTRALALTREEDATFDLLLKREDVLHLIGDRAGQGEDLDRLARIAASVERPAWRASVNLRRARHVIALADYGGASAFAEEAARWARAATDLSLESEAYTATAEIDLLQGRAEPARASYREALRLAREAGDVRRETTALIGMGACAESLSEYREAIEVYEESLHLARSASLRRLEGEILHNLGTIAHRIADLAASIDYFERAMSIRRATGDRSGEAATLYSRAIVAHIQLDYEGCLAYAQRALSLHLAIHDRRGESNDLRLVAHAYTRMNRFADARHHNARSLAIAREIGNLRGVSVSLTNLGNLAALTGQLDAAHRYFVEALAVKREIGDRHGQGDVLQNLAWISKARGEVRAIPPLIEEALTIRREIGDRRGEAFALTFLIDASVAVDDWDEGEGHLAEARKIARQIDELPLTLDLHAHAARLRRLRGDLDGAMDEVAPILERLDAEYHLHGDPFDIYCECVRTLRAVGDPRANPILTAVHDRLQEHANIIPEEEMRRSFLVDLPWNREIVEMWEASRNW